MIVVDASVVVELLRRTPDGAMIASRLGAAPKPFHAPAFLDTEVAQALRRFALRGTLSGAAGMAALRALQLLPVRRYAPGPLVERAWSLRASVTAYDATYVALAERLGATFLTRDARLARAPGLPATVELI